MKQKFTAILIGGPFDGQKWELDEANMEIKITQSVLQKNGEWTECGTAKYKLHSNGAPLKYEFLA
jgi:hypothetical protein